MELPETRFAVAANGDRIAYQTLGEGPRDLVYTSGLWSHLDLQWEEAGTARMFRRLASCGRLIRFDRRGTGASDPRTGPPSTIVDDWIEDLLAVLDATGSRQPVILAIVDSGPLVLSFVDRHPERCSGLIFVNTIACLAARPDYPEGHSPEAIQAFREFFATAWGNPAFGSRWTPSQAHHPGFLQWYAKLQRAMASPRSVVENFDALAALDARPALARVRVPTLVMARRHLTMLTLEQARAIANGIPGARFIELPGSDGTVAWETPDLIFDHVEEFMTGRRARRQVPRQLLTVLFTDLVASTAHAARLGDAPWQRLLDQHDAVVDGQVRIRGGRLVERTGDGTLSTFAGPSQAIDCAHAIRQELASLGLALRSGLHLGEVELRDDGRIGGLAVHLSARVAALAQPDEVLASGTVHDVLLGSDYRFSPRGTHALKGVPGQWPVFAVAAPDADLAD